MPTSARLTYRRLDAGNLDAFHALAIDPHVRRYLLDGAVVERAWCEAEVERSEALFTSHGVGLWLAALEDEHVGFCGFRVFEELGPAPQLLYALAERFTGRGLATEAAEACVRFALAQGRLEVLSAAVDEPNRASIRVLEKLGFRSIGVRPGAFGRTILFERDR